MTKSSFGAALLAAAIATAFAFAAERANTRVAIEITEPADDAPVCEHGIVRGTVSDPDTYIHVFTRVSHSQSWHWVGSARPKGKLWEAKGTWGTPIHGIENRFFTVAVATKKKGMFGESHVVHNLYPFERYSEIAGKSPHVLVLRKACSQGPASH